MSRSRGIPAQLSAGPFRSADARRFGLTDRELQGGRFRHVLHDVYAPASLPDSLGLRCAAARLISPETAVFCGVTAARLYDLPVPGHDQRIHVAIPAGTSTIPRVRGLIVHGYTIPSRQIQRYDGWCLIGPERLFLELAACLPRTALIVVGDRMLRQGLTTRETIGRFLRESYRRRGVWRAREAVPHLEESTDSPPETHLRMLLVDANLPRPVANRDVYDRRTGRWLARPDLSYPELKIAIQYEGAHHQRDPAQYAYDIERDGRLIDEGWIVIRVDKEALFRHPYTVVNRVRRAITSRR